MVRSKKYINVDTKILAIQAQKEEEPISEEQSIVDKLYILNVNNKSNQIITIHHALPVLN
ncbi:hypothetical protein ACIQZG_01910 [Lysinibacillus sp. NPDC096418]|uniref:hypothetical protein n=1 Tax=Lysinibacillus sp. NPDC096418 TaxID=3364138 RepID=UPI00382BB3CD